MKNLTLFFFGLLILGCSSDDGNETTTEEIVNSLKYTVKLKNEPNEIIYIQEYSFDEQEKVISENYTNINNPQHSHLSTFEYDDNGRILKEIRDGEVFFNVIWTNDFAEVYNIQNQKISEFNYLTSIVIQKESKDYQIKSKVVNSVGESDWSEPVVVKAVVTKKTTITCVKGKLIKKVTAVKPICPSGYKVKK